ncbi:GNAT family N-acetyltransferase [Nonomuraea sp. NPDC050556]|uniref:GNAT family N-acetyltransferase n=1 Tax=Nonomuraea sp. NPDC050556 TaxID=3364369 RepID=UPI0037943F87
MEPKIEVATLDDLPDLIASAAALFREDAGTRDPYVDVEWAERSGEPYYSDMITNPRNLALLVRSDGATVGHLTAQLGPPRETRPDAVVASLMSLHVEASARSRGVGALLVEEFFSWARAQGANQAIVSAFAANVDAIRFYQARGFAPDTLSLKTDL